MKLHIFIFGLLFLLTACTESNILVMPKDKQGEYCVTKTDYTNWAGNKSITLVDDKSNTITCSGDHRLIQEESLACEDKTYSAQLTCFHDIKVNLTYTLKASCKEAYGIAVVDSGKEYEVFMGISDAEMKAKIDEYEKARL